MKLPNINITFMYPYVILYDSNKQNIKRLREAHLAEPTNKKICNFCNLIHSDPFIVNG